MLKTLRLREFSLMETLEGIKVKPAHMLAALGGILLLAYVVVGVSYYRLRSEQPGLKDQIEAGDGTLSSVAAQQQPLKDLQDQLVYMKNGLAALQQALPPKLDSAVIVQKLVDYAGEAHVNVTQMNALPATQVKGDNQADSGYFVLHYTLVIAGTQPDMLSFLSLLEKGVTQTAALGDVEIKSGLTGNEMTLQVSFYAKPQSTAATPTPAPKATPSNGKAKSN